MSTNSLNVVASENPFGGSSFKRYNEGVSIADIIDDLDISKDLLPHLHVKVVDGPEPSVVPMVAWGSVHPPAGSHIEICPVVQGAVLAPLLTAALASAAPTIAGQLFSTTFLMSTFNATLAVAAVNVVGALLIRALIPPPSQSTRASGDETVFNITGASNATTPYETYPTVIGRHIMFPKKTASGFTEVVDDEIYLRERMTFGYGPVAISDLKIGTTPITEFEGVEIEFLNVDQTLTEASIPGISDLVVRNRDERLRPNFKLKSGFLNIADETVFDYTPRSAPSNISLGFVNLGNLVSGDVTVRIETYVGASTTPEMSEDFVLAGSSSGVVTWDSPVWSDGLSRRVTAKVLSGGILTAAAVNVAEASSLYFGNQDTLAWRQGSETMTLYPDDIAEDPYNVTLEADAAVVRQTRINAVSANVDISFQGLVNIAQDGAQTDRTVDVLIEYREVGDLDWIIHETKSCTESTTSFVRFTSSINFPTEGTYDIRVTRVTPDTEEDTTIRDVATLSAIRTVQAGLLPSHPEIAEIAIRIKASNELNGQLQNLNAVVQQLAPVWDGTNMTAPQPIRHPAWAYLAALTGPQLRDAVDVSRIDLAALKAWADEEPHWTCDFVVESSTRLADVLDLICATGRARRGLSDLKYSIIRDGGAGGVVQYFSPVNSSGFKGRRFLDREIHAFRVRFVSQRKNWARDEIIVYADGYNADNATEFETLTLPGVVLGENSDNEGNAYRLARYHLAVAKQRQEEFEFYSSLDHLVCQMGDKITVTHDVPLFGVGSARVSSITLDGNGGVSRVMLDGHFDISDPTYRLRVRRSDGTESAFNASYVENEGWQPVNPQDPQGIAFDDLVLVEKTTSQQVDLLITSIVHTPSDDDDLRARITALPAAPEVLNADVGVIPDYDPQITSTIQFGPDFPVVRSIRSDRLTAYVWRDGSVVPRIRVRIAMPNAKKNRILYVQLQWRKVGSRLWVEGKSESYTSEISTPPGGVTNEADYDVQVRSLDAEGRTRGWVDAGRVRAVSNVLIPTRPTNWTGRAGVDFVSFGSDQPVELDTKEFRLYAATDASENLTLVDRSKTTSFTYKPDGSDGFTRYKVVAVDNSGVESDPTDFIPAQPTGVQVVNLASDTAQLIEDAAQSAQADKDAAVAAAATATANAQQTASDLLTNQQVTIDSLPSTFERDGDYFTSRLTGAPDTRAPLPETLSFADDTSMGRVLVATKPTVSQELIAPRGYIRNPQLGRTYRMTITAKHVGPIDVSSGPEHILAVLAKLDGSYAFISNVVFANLTFDAADVTQTFVVEYEFAGVGAAFLVPHLRFRTNYNPTGVEIRVSEFLVQDVTAEASASSSAQVAATASGDAQSHANAAAGSASLALSRSNDAEQFATAAQASATSASADRAAVEVIEGEVVQIRDDAEGLVATATSFVDAAASLTIEGDQVLADPYFAGDPGVTWAWWSQAGTTVPNEQFGYGRTLVFDAPADLNFGTSAGSTNARWRTGQAGFRSYVFEVTFTWESGADLDGAGFYMIWVTQTGDPNHIEFINLTDCIEGDVTVGRTYTARAVMSVPDGFDLTNFVSHSAHFMVNWQGFGVPRTAKKIRLHKQSITPTTVTEASVVQSSTAISTINQRLGVYSVAVTAGSAAAGFQVSLLDADGAEPVGDFVIDNLNFASSNYAEDANGNPTAGMKFDATNDVLKAREAIFGDALALNAISTLFRHEVTVLNLPSTAGGDTTNLSDYCHMTFADLGLNGSDLNRTAFAGYRYDFEIIAKVKGRATGGAAMAGMYAGQIEAGLFRNPATIGNTTLYLTGELAHAPVFASDDYQASGTMRDADFEVNLQTNSSTGSPRGFAIANRSDRPLDVTLQVTCIRTKI